MPEPVLPAAATIAAQAVVVAPLTVFGMKLGLQADVLLAGFCGSVTAMALLNTVPTTGDTLRELLRTSMRRVGVAIGSALFAGYTAPLSLLLANVPGSLVLSMAFLLGAGAQYLLPKWISWATPPVRPAAGDQP
jgi:hypothetical protein